MIKLLLTTYALCCGLSATDEGVVPGAVRIWPLGDSITGGYTENAGYRRLLWQKLHAAGRNVDFVGTITNYIEGEPEDPDFDTAHDGHWGWRTDEILAQVEAWTAQVKPDMVLLTIGTNDLYQKRPVDEAAANIAEIIRRIRAVNPAVVVLLAQIPANDMAVETTPALNIKIKQLASMSTKESPVVIVDQYSGFEAGADTWDGVHPNARGAEKMAVRWLDAIKRTLNSM